MKDDIAENSRDKETENRGCIKREMGGGFACKDT